MYHSKKYLLSVLFLFFFIIISMPLYAGLEKVIYNNPPADQFMTKWIVSAPLHVFPPAQESNDEETQKRAFADDLLKDVGGEAGLTFTVISGMDKKIGWKTINSKTDAVDLVSVFREKEYVVVYAFAEINLQEEQKLLLGIGSDDGIKVWLNGNLVHENWVGRSVNADDDVVPVTLQKGENRLVLKVQNMQGGWGFSCHIMGKTALNKKLFTAVATGDLDNVKMLLEYGADVNSKSEHGVSVLQAAQIKGRTEIQQLLQEKGADATKPMLSAQELTDNLFNQYFNNKTSGASVLVARDGAILYQKGYGMQNMGKKLAVTPETQFRIGSITKQFTAAAILKLQEEGKLSVTDKLSKYYPDFPRGDEVTIHQLLTHISGIHSYTNREGFVSRVEKTIKSDELLKLIESDPFDFDPGEKLQYNNSAYFILGCIIEQISGLSYNEFLHENFFEPLGMQNTGVHYHDIKLQNEAIGYSYYNGEFKKALNWDMSWAGGAGNLYSTVDDLFKWNEGLYLGKVLNESSLQAAFTPVKLNNGTIPKEIGQYGYGLVIGEFRGKAEIGHGGGLHGFSTYLVRFPQMNVTVVVLSNAEPGAPGFSPSQAAHDVAEYFFYPELLERKTIVTDKSIDPKSYIEYVGRYDYSIGMMEFTVEGDKLFAQFTGQGKAEIYPSTKDEFFWKVVDASLKFLRDENGKVTHVIHYQGGKEIKAPRIEEVSTVQVDPAIYNTYTGEYELAPNFILTVSKENNHLYVQATNQDRFEIYPSSETEFFYKVVKAEITFNKNDKGKVISLTLHQAGRDMPALKK